MSVSSAIRSEIEAALPSKFDAAMVFGSAARNDMSPESDVDVLVLRERNAKSHKHGRINFSVYTVAHLSKMAREGSLFVRHLIQDGAYLHDTRGLLAECLRQYKRPRDYAKFWSALRLILPLLVIDKEHPQRCHKTYLEVASFVLRTAMYIKADERGILTFSLRQLEERTGWHEVALLRRAKLASDRECMSLFLEILEALAKVLSATPTNPSQTPEAYMVNNYEKDPLIVALGLRLLSGENVPLNYDFLSPLAIVS